MDPLIWATGLLIVGLALVILEVFIPSGGIIGVLSIVSIVGSLVMASFQGTTTFLTFLVIAMIALPACFAFAIRVWPDTPLGRRILPSIPDSDAVLPDREQRQRLQQLVGKTGRARSLMLPSGAAEIEGRTYDALSEGVAIEPGQPVKVVEVRGNRIVVRPATGESVTPRGDDMLSQPIDSLGLGPFDEPLA